MKRYRRLGPLLAVALIGCGGGDQVRPPAPAPPRDAAPQRRAPAPRTDPAAIAARATVPVLCYHQIRAPTAADAAQDRPYIVSPRVFARQMDALADAGYTPVGGDALVAHVARGTELPRKPVLLTFDDGSEGQITHALPVLRRHRFRATFFVMTVVLGRRGWFSRSQVRTLDRAGMTIGAHTWDHHVVAQYAGDDWRRQIDEPTKELSTLVGHPVRVFAYPYGLWSRAGIEHLRAAGFAGAFQLADRLDRQAPLWTLRRIIVPEWTGTRLLREMRRDF